jgi:ferritin-like metal-binding protein YciE
MGLFTREIKTFDDLFAHGLKDIYYAENRIIKALPSLIEKANDEQLKRELSAHLRQTEQQARRLEKIFKMREEKVKGTLCPGIDGLLEEGDELVGHVADDEEVLDAAIVAAAQAVEHYEITRYGCLISWARELEHEDWAKLLEETLAEEKAADRKLTALAERRVNRKAQGNPAAPLKTARKAGSGKRRSTGTAATRKRAAKKRSVVSDRRRSMRKRSG